MTIQLIDVVTPDIGLKTVGDKLNNNFSNSAHAASYEVGAGAGQIPTNANLSAAVAGTATFSGDVYIFSTSGTGFPPLNAGMFISFKLPSGSSNTTTTPDISYNSTTYVIKWIDGSALEADDLDEAYNKQPILFYFDGTDMLVASDISGSNANGGWERCLSGRQQCLKSFTENIAITGPSGLGGFVANGSSRSMPKSFSETPDSASCTFFNNPVSCGFTLGGVSASSYAVQYRSINSSSAQDRDVSVCFTGRWY